MSHPASVNLPTEKQRIILDVLVEAQPRIIALMRPAADCDGCAFEIMLIDLF
jgi:Xaa-Pro aminopeptidase